VVQIRASGVLAGTDQLEQWFDDQVPSRVFAVPNVTSDTLDVRDDARSAAREFWARGSDDARLSDDIRFACARNAQLLAK
jgi:hypothetical protein